MSYNPRFRGRGNAPDQRQSDGRGRGRGTRGFSHRGGRGGHRPRASSNAGPPTAWTTPTPPPPPPSNLLAATTFALQQSRPQAPVPIYPPQASFAPYPPASSSGYVPRHHATHHMHYPPQAGPSHAPRTTAEGYTISEAAPRYWREEELEIDDAGPSRKRSRTDDAKDAVDRPRCEPCRRSFWSEAEIVAHRRLHVKCTEPGCAFEASPKAVEIHEEDRHLRFKPGKQPERTKPDGPPNATIQGLGMALRDPQQIAKWLEERKKRWPSQANVAEKERQRLERVASGLEPDRPARRGRGRGRGQDRGGHGRGGYAGRGAAPVPVVSAQRDAESSTEDSTSEETDTDGPPEVASSGAPLAKMAVEGQGQLTDEDSDSDEASSSADAMPEEVSSKVPEVDMGDEVVHKIQRTCKYWARGTCHSGDACRYLHSRPDRSAQAPRPKVQDPPAPTRPPDLMSKLLANDIAHEVSDLLQVIHFLADNDYLDDVELRPGEADERFIEVLPDEGAPTGVEQATD